MRLKPDSRLIASGRLFLAHSRPPLPHVCFWPLAEGLLCSGGTGKADDAIDIKDAGGISIIKMADGNPGMHAIFEPGWTWEKDEKPLLGSPYTCPMRHTGYCIGGNLVVRMVKSNTETRISTGDFFEIPPGHDAYADGSERVELVLFASPEESH